ncbi:phage distal tail protein [Clostridium baratii]|uniref:phage distal tail protein n=1 Tax=Clostridium baratii TaxID=1561 RepID=UPI003D795714
MLINNIDITNFNARVLDINIQNSSIETDKDITILKDLFPIFFSSKIGLNTIKVTLLINSLEKRQYYLDKSNLLKNMIDPFEVNFKDRNLKFKCVLANQMDQASLKQIRGRLQLTMYGYNIENEVTEVLNKVSYKVISVKGNYKVPCLLEIIPSLDLIDLSIKGVSEDIITIKNLQANKKIVIDGREGTVTQEGKNKFIDTDMWEFPFLVPGENIIQLSKNSCIVNIKYEPRYI